MADKMIKVTGKIDYLGLKKGKKSGQNFVELKITQTMSNLNNSRRKRFFHIIKVFNKELINKCQALLPGDLIEVTGNVINNKLKIGTAAGQYILMQSLVPVRV